MHKRSSATGQGFTLVELLIVMVVISILTVISVVAYNGVTRDAADASVVNSLKNAGETVEVELIQNRKLPIGMPDNFAASPDVSVTYIPDEGTVHYSDLSPVQNGVLFYNICRELITDPEYSTIHSRDGNQSQNVVMRCDDSISANSLLITGWDSKTWSTPLSESTLRNYIDSVPYDSWWIDRQDVVRGFYTQLIERFTERGGTWPIANFWDPWANEWSGTPKEELPQPDPASDLTQYCIVAMHYQYPGLSYFLTADDQQIRPGNCDSTS